MHMHLCIFLKNWKDFVLDKNPILCWIAFSSLAWLYCIKIYFLYYLVGLYNVPIYLGTKPLFLQIRRIWFCSIWSPKSKFKDKTVNSFQINSKKKKRKKMVSGRQTEPAGSAQPASSAPRARRPERRILSAAGPANPHILLPFLFHYFLTAGAHLSSPRSVQEISTYTFPVQIQSPSKLHQFVADLSRFLAPINTPRPPLSFPFETLKKIRHRWGQPPPPLLLWRRARPAARGPRRRRRTAAAADRRWSTAFDPSQWPSSSFWIPSVIFF
jgi:hypothetical protein